MAPRKMKQQAMEPKMKEALKVRLQVKRVKTEMGKIKEDQKCITEAQRKIRGRYEEIERQCDELKEETEMIMKQTDSTQIKLVLMLAVLKAREGGYLTEAATLTHFLREFVEKERANNNASLAALKYKHP